MATKNYFISMKNPRLDSGIDESNYDPSTYPSQLTLCVSFSTVYAASTLALLYNVHDGV